VSDVPAERVARNEAVFREANEHIRDAAITHDVRARVPFLCECADEGCREIVRLSLEEYEAVRQDPRRFINAPDHHLQFTHAVRRVEQHDGYDVVEKIGVAGEVAEELDPRQGDSTSGRPS
jgi:hypothetical protein